MIKLTLHAQASVRQRHLKMAWIEATVLSPARQAADKDPALTQAFRPISEFGGRILKVVHRRDGADILVVTAYFDRGARIS